MLEGNDVAGRYTSRQSRLWVSSQFDVVKSSQICYGQVEPCLHELR